MDKIKDQTLIVINCQLCQWSRELVSKFLICQSFSLDNNYNVNYFVECACILYYHYRQEFIIKLYCIQAILSDFGDFLPLKLCAMYISY